ncbi:hypothetical protein BCR34DRAFT_339586 [Clohesyomyces aquaticus]|uniref:Uncharacterized protein n=1 Tax=Clohesyomyces aquaticus TaxID=1231657 RepID=A0A1Y1ZKK1_9PLEO|nr:hypothetical protein BCR34DRAFT_339586 [Clohesyomyces aquaticus]
MCETIRTTDTLMLMYDIRLVQHAISDPPWSITPRSQSLPPPDSPVAVARQNNPPHSSLQPQDPDPETRTSTYTISRRNNSAGSTPPNAVRHCGFTLASPYWTVKASLAFYRTFFYPSRRYGFFFIWPRSSSTPMVSCLWMRLLVDC